MSVEYTTFHWRIALLVALFGKLMKPCTNKTAKGTKEIKHGNNRNQRLKN